VAVYYLTGGNLRWLEESKQAMDWALPHDYVMLTEEPDPHKCASADVILVGTRREDVWSKVPRKHRPRAVVLSEVTPSPIAIRTVAEEAGFHALFLRFAPRDTAGRAAIALMWMAERGHALPPLYAGGFLNAAQEALREHRVNAETDLAPHAYAAYEVLRNGGTKSRAEEAARAVWRELESRRQNGEE
jgi:hypothetical protein